MVTQKQRGKGSSKYDRIMAMKEKEGQMLKSRNKLNSALTSIIFYRSFLEDLV